MRKYTLFYFISTFKAKNCIFST